MKDAYSLSIDQKQFKANFKILSSLLGIFFGKRIGLDYPSSYCR